MDDIQRKLSEHFESIRADERLKRYARAHVRKRTHDYGRFDRRKTRVHRLAGSLAAATVFIAILGVNYIPISTIDLDVNPSVEMKINALGQVTEVRGLNSDGVEVAQSIDVVRLPYEKALHRLLLSDVMLPYLEKNCAIFITVVGVTPTHNRDMLEIAVCNTKAVTNTTENLYYCQVDPSTAKEAATQGLSPARYVALLKLRQTYPDITAEDIQNMSMLEIRELTGFQEIDDPCGDQTGG